MTSSAVGVLLAAGKSTRFGANKLLQPLPDTQVAMALQAARHLCKAIPESVAVIRDEDHDLQKLLSQTGIGIVSNKEAEKGMSTSIVCGINATPDAGGWIFALADMPYITTATISLVLRALRDGALIAAPTYNGQRGHPVGFSWQLKKELVELRGDRGAKTVIERYRDELVRVAVNDNGILRDIDRRSDIVSR